MSIYHVLSSSVYPYFKEMIDYLLTERKKVNSDDLQIAMNLNIILDCACYVEGFLESKLKSIVRYYQEIYRKVEIPEFEIRKPHNMFFKNIENDLNQRISQCIGIDKYNDLFILLLRKSFKEDKNIVHLIEPIKALFQLRNVIAHGREINAFEKIINYETIQGEEYFFGGYKNAESLLIKKGIIKDKFIKVHNIRIFFLITLLTIF